MKIMVRRGRAYITTRTSLIGIALLPSARFGTLSGKPKWVLKVY